LNLFNIKYEYLFIIIIIIIFFFRLKYLLQIKYINWYIDGKFIHSIGVGALNVTGASIPEEPMYILLNTAMSSRWGFTDPVPAG
jgi:hypothetical protein